MRFLILNGPNLNLQGLRQPEIYGNVTMDECIGALVEKFSDHRLDHFQSNHEGGLIDKIQQYGFDSDGIVLNAAAYSHTSIAIADAIAAVPVPVVEVHISDIHSREDFRKHSYLSAVCKHTITGKGLEGYELALQYLLSNAGS